MNTVASEESNPSQTVSHQTAIDETERNMPCARFHGTSDNPAESLPEAHLDCEGCDELKDSCATPDYIFASTEISRLIPPTEVDPDSDLDMIYSGMDPPWHTWNMPLDLSLNRSVTVFIADTPISLKDQLTE